MATIEEAKKLYNAGEWNKSLEILEDIPGREARALEAWNWWKEGGGGNDQAVAEALKICEATLTDERPDEVNSSLLSLRALIAQRQKETSEVTLAFLDDCFASLPPEKEGSDGHAMRLNTAFIISAQLKNFSRAQEYYSQVVALNARNGNGHQLAKNQYNLASLVLRPQDKYLEMRQVLLGIAIPLYQSVGAYSDEAAAWYQVGWAFEQEENWGRADEAYAKSEVLWIELEVPNRIREAQNNRQRIAEKRGG
jgi:tetratricopeptide (TPR) repeat protein